MRILHVSGATAWGGNEQQLVDLIFGLQKLHVDNTLFCFENSPIDINAKQNGINSYNIPKAKGHSLKYAKALKNYVKKYSPDIIHIHTSNSVTAFVIADILYRLKTPAVFSKKGLSGAMSKLSVFKYNFKNINKIICVSKIVEENFKNTLKSKNHHKLCVIYDAVKLERSKSNSLIKLRKKFSVDDSKVLIGNIANHTEAKDLAIFIKTINELVNNLGVNNVHFIQIGKEGKHSKDFLPLIEEHKLESYVTVTGFMENAMNLISQMDIFIITSQREGGPSSGLEAICEKVPIVSTKVGVMQEIITHQENGLLSNIKDYKSLALNLKTLIENKELQNQFAEKSYKILLQKFTTKELAEKTLSVYKELSSN